jgi:transposase
MDAYSMDLRRRVLADCDGGMRTRAVAGKYRVSESWVRRLKQRRRATGETAPRRPGGRRPRTIDRDRLAAASAAHPDATLAELRAKLGLSCSLSAVHQALAALRVTLKKR